MSFEKVMQTVSGWMTATEALAAFGAQLTLDQSGESAPPEIEAGLRRVVEAAGLEGLDGLAPPQRAMLIGFVQQYLRQAADLMAEPGRSPGWRYTDPVILDSWGRGSSMVPALIAQAHPDLADVSSFLDVGAGVGLLAVAAAGVWPSSRVVGIDTWPTSLERARANIDAAGVADRITVRDQDVADLDDVDAYDCVWIPSFFIPEAVFEKALSAVLRALQPGGWVAVGRFKTPAGALERALDSLQILRNGGADLERDQVIKLVESVGFSAVHSFEPPAPAPLELILGQRS